MAPELPLIARLRRTNRERCLLTHGARVLVAVSGGPDSLALLHALHALREELEIELAAAYLDHRMRGSGGESDAGFVREIGRAWGVPVEVGARDVPRLARRAGISLEEAGRAARYRFFRRAARRAGCTIVATAHTADDRVETVLLNLLRGTGLDGLAGIPARHPLPLRRAELEVVRPFIDVTRAEVLQYCVAHGLHPRHDTTNDSPAFLRNRIRAELLPLLEAEYSASVRRHLLRLAGLAESETDLLDAQARQLLREADGSGLNTEARRRGDGSEREGSRSPSSESSALYDPCVWGRYATASSLCSSGGPLLCLARQPLTSAPPGLARRALRLAIQSVQGGAPPDWATVERLFSLAKGERPGFTLPGGRVRARTTSEALVLEPVRPPAPPFLSAKPVLLTIPGSTLLPWGAGLLTTRPHPLAPSPHHWGRENEREAPPKLPPPPAFGGGGQGVRAGSPPSHAYLDLAALSGPLRARPPQPGDRVRPLGMSGHRKLQDLLVDRKIPLVLRRRLPVVCDDEKIVWVAGCCLSDAARLTAASREALLLIWTPSAAEPPFSTQ